MKTLTTAGFLAIAHRSGSPGPHFGGAPQAPLSDLPPVDYSLGPDSQPQPGVPKGTLTRHVLAPGKFFPGTPHNYQLYVPAQYDREPPDRVHDLPGRQRLRGQQRTRAGRPRQSDRQARRAADDRDLPRSRRDAGALRSGAESVRAHLRVRLADAAVREFPDRRARCPRSPRTYNLSKDANDHGIAGISTGGVGAFVAAWNRPDQFRRVITWIGSFGNFRGADRLPGLIRRTEPRPIRVFMQTGRQDLVNYAGSWYLENPRMAAALEFAGQRREDRVGRRRPQQPPRRVDAARHAAMAVARLSAADRRDRAAAGRGPRHCSRSSCRGASGAAAAARRAAAAGRSRAGRRDEAAVRAAPSTR